MIKSFTIVIIFLNVSQASSKSGRGDLQLSDFVVDGSNEVVIYDFKTNQYTSYLKKSLARENVQTITEGLNQILDNGDLFVEETDFGRALFFNADGSLRWQYVNRSNDGAIYALSWSRILYKSDNLEQVNKFLESKKECVNE